MPPKMRSYAILIICLLAISLLGCDMTSSSRQSADYYKGTKGIVMSFMDGLPPDRLFEGDPLQAVIELQNTGAYPEKGAPEGKLYISGFDSNAINGYWDNYADFPSDLPGKTPINPTGGREMKKYYDREVRVPFDNEKYSTTIQVTSCYKYRTLATPTVCIDPEPGNRIPDKPCKSSIVTLSGGQGAPVAVTKIEPRTSSDGIYFTIYIQNVGNGKLIASDKYSKCPYELDYNDINKVLVRAELPFDKAPECTPDGTSYRPVVLTNSGSGAITCRFNNPGGDAYTTTLKIQLDYVYSESIKKNLEIVNLDYLQ